MKTIDARNAQVVRILNVLTTLAESGRALTVREILDEHYGGRGRRTFFRDLDAVREAGVRVERKALPASREMTYRIPRPPNFARLQFTEEELFSLFFARGALRALEGTPFWRGIDSALEKIIALLPEEMQQFCVFSESYFVARNPRAVNYEAHAETIAALGRAIPRDRKCVIEYRKPGSKDVDRHVFRPYYVAYVDGLLYLRGFSQLRDGERTLRVDRIRSVEVLGDTFERPDEYKHENLDAESVFSGGFGIIESPDLEEVEVEFSPSAARFVRERKWHPTQQATDLPGGKVRLLLRVALSVELTQWILSYGEEARVIAPTVLKKEVAQRHNNAARRYRAGKP
jgi:predicted DNA-binding transcriptional regulator YafY